MSAVLIVVIVVVVVLLIGALVALPRIRERARIRAGEKEIGQRRDRVATEHREEAQGREQQADVAERRARIAEQEAARERAEAQLHQERAAMHEQGLADHELVSEDEHDRFAGTSALEGQSGAAQADRVEPTGAARDGEGQAVDPGRTSETR